MRKLLGLVAAVGVSLICGVTLQSGEAWADIVSGGAGAGSNGGACGDGSGDCYNGYVWVHYSITGSATSGRVGDVPSRFGGGEGPTIPFKGSDSCEMRGNGFWILQYRQTTHSGAREYAAYGSIAANEINGILDFSDAGIPARDEEWCEGASGMCLYTEGNSGVDSVVSGTYSSSVTPDDYGIKMSDAKTFYESWKESTDPSWDSFVSGGGAWFCGAKNIQESESATAKFSGKVALTVKSDFDPAGTTKSGIRKYRAYGVKTSISEPVTATPVIKRKNDGGVPNAVKTKYKLVFGGSYPSLSGSGVAETTALTAGSQFLNPAVIKPTGSSASVGITVDDEGNKKWQKYCFALTYNNKISFTSDDGGAHWSETGTRGEAHGRSCVYLMNYNSKDAVFEGDTSGIWSAGNSAKAVPLSGAGTNTGTVQSVVLDASGTPLMDAEGNPQNAFTAVTSVTYDYEFTHTVELTNKSSMVSFFNRGYTGNGTDVQINYKIFEKKDGGGYSEKESGVWTSGGHPKIGDWSDMEKIQRGEVTIGKDDDDGHVICQYMQYTKKISYVTTSSGLSQSKSSGETAEQCVYLGTQTVEDVEEEFDGGEVIVEGDTKDDNIAFNGGFQRLGDDVWRASELTMTGSFSHEMWLNTQEKSGVSSGLTFNEEASADDNGQGVPFKGNGIKAETFVTDYIGKAAFAGKTGVGLKPTNAGGNSIGAPAVQGFGLDLKIANITDNLFDVTGTRNGGGNKTGGSLDDPWTSTLNGAGSTQLTIGSGAGDGDLDLLAGEDGVLAVRTANTPWKWSAKYNKVSLRVTTNTKNADGSSSSSSSPDKPYKVTFGGIEVSDDSLHESEHVDDIKVHRDYNFKVEKFRLANASGNQAFGGASAVVTAGQKATVEFLFNVGAHKGLDQEWDDGHKRNYYTDVFETKTRAYLVRFETKPDADIEAALNGAQNYDGLESEIKKTESELRNWLEDKLGSVENYEASDISGDAARDPFMTAKKGGTATPLRGNAVYGHGTEDQRKDLSYSVEVTVSDDAIVGGKYCVGIFVENPTNEEEEGIEKNTDTSLLSELACANVVKKPSMEVWGGDVAAEGGIQTSLSNKFFESEDKTRTYGSWGDFGVIASKEAVKNMSSGRWIVNGKDWAAGGGAGQAGMDSFSKMTIANYDGSFGEARIDGIGKSLADELKGRYSETSDVTRDNGVEIRTGVSSVNAGIWGGGEVTKPYVIKGDNMTIKDNIIVKQDGYTNGNIQVPQVVIVADGDVSIEDGVTRVDAWIVANGDIDTCTLDMVSNNNVRIGGGLGAGVCSAELNINGPVIGKKVAFDRTKNGNPNGRIYLESGGSYSVAGDEVEWDNSLGKSAEKIDFSPASILFGIQESSGGAPRTTYVRKLAPRY